MQRTQFSMLIASNGQLVCALHFFSKLPGKNFASWTRVVNLRPTSCSHPQVYSTSQAAVGSQDKRTLASPLTSCIGLWRRQSSASKAVQASEFSSRQGSVQAAVNYEMNFLESLLQKNFNQHHKLLQIHTLLITSGFLNPIQNPKFNNWKPTTYTFNCLIKCHPQNSLHFFVQILNFSLLPNPHTFPSVIKSIKHLPLLQSTHSQVICRGLIKDDFTNCTIVDSYACFFLPNNARKVFDEITSPDLVSSNSMLNAYCINGQLAQALDFFKRIPSGNIVSWTSVINGLAKHGQFQEAINIFREFCKEFEPNEATLVSILLACASSNSARQGKEIHSYIVTHGVSLTTFLATSLIDFYGKHGHMEACSSIFELCERREVCTWNALIMALACNSREMEAVKVLAEMTLMPNHITFVALLTACSRGNLVEVGLSLFESMHRKYGVVARMEHYGCVVDMLSRAGQVRRAWEFVERMPVEPEDSVLGAILGACKVYGDDELGSIVGRKVMKMQPWHCGRYMVLRNLYAQGGKWDEADEVKIKMEMSGVKKVIGCSWLNFR